MVFKNKQQKWIFFQHNSAFVVLMMAVLSWLAPVPASAFGRSNPGDETGKIRVGDTVRTFLIHVPNTAAPKAGYPVVLAIHGGGGRGSKMAQLMKLEPFADTQGFLVVYPDGLDRHWNDGRSSIKNKSDDVGFISALLDEVGRRYPVDAMRIFAVGISNGAAFTERLGCELSDRIVAIAAVSGTMAAELAPSCHPSRPISVLQIAGTADPIMPYDGGEVKTIMGAGEGGRVLSARDTVDLWARLDRCASPSPPSTSPPSTLPPSDRPDGTSITRLSFPGCKGGAAVTLLTVQNGGHAWPGGPQFLPRLFGRTRNQLDASRAVVDFFFSRAAR